MTAGPLAADAAQLFDTALMARLPRFGVEPEDIRHRPLLLDLMIACSPLAGLLPPAMLEMQFDGQDAGFVAEWPLATRRVVTLDGAVIGRIILDWQAADRSHGVDIAVHPDHRSSGAGLAMLRAWLDVADRSGRRCTLDVIADNPARRIYRRLGFVEHAAEPGAPYLFMERPLGGKASRVVGAPGSGSSAMGR